MRYTKKFKEDIVTRYSKGESVHDLSLSTEASVSTIYSWIKNSVGILRVTGLHKTIKEQEKKISRLENMIKIIQNADFLKMFLCLKDWKLLMKCGKNMVLTLLVMLQMLHGVLSIIIKSEARVKTIYTKTQERIVA